MNLLSGWTDEKLAQAAASDQVKLPPAWTNAYKVHALDVTSYMKKLEHLVDGKIVEYDRKHFIAELLL